MSEKRIKYIANYDNEEFATLSFGDIELRISYTSLHHFRIDNSSPTYGHEAALANNFIDLIMAKMTQDQAGYEKKLSYMERFQLFSWDNNRKIYRFKIPKAVAPDRPDQFNITAETKNHWIVETVNPHQYAIALDDWQAEEIKSTQTNVV